MVSFASVMRDGGGLDCSHLDNKETITQKNPLKIVAPHCKRYHIDGCFDSNLSEEQIHQVLEHLGFYMYKLEQRQ